MIETDKLTRCYGNLTAVDALTMCVEPGQVLGLLGPNGAGKSTAMRLIAGFLVPTSGSARVCGYDVSKEPLKVKRALGYLPEGAPSYGEMTVREFLQFIVRIRGLKPDAGFRRFDAVVQQLQLEEVLNACIETLSKGLRRRVGLAQAILHDPPVLMLDEPTDGLDPNQKHVGHRGDKVAAQFPAHHRRHGTHGSASAPLLSPTVIWRNTSSSRPRSS